MFNSFIKGSIILVILFVVALSAAFIYAYEEISLDADKVINYKPQTSSVILDRNGEKIAYVFKKQHRLYATYEELPGFLVEALVAMEDTQFFEHSGINPDAIIRAIVKDVKAGRFVEGGSTITQQLIKNKILTNEKKLARKIKEAILAIKIENVLSKEEIIERYLNEISYGNNYFGIKTAANGYFHKELNELSHKEIALLIGLPNAPSYYNPLRHYKRSLNRANNVLYRMKSLGWINEEDYLKSVKESPKVYKTSLTQNISPYIVDEVLRRYIGKLGDIRTGGYKIYTTIDLKQQKIAEDAVDMAYKKALKKYKEDPKKSTLNAAFVAVESSTGDILAMIGGVNYGKSVFNRATQAERQPGSAFKPFIYQTALDMGYNPATPLTDLARTFHYYANGKPKVWAPKNYERNFKGFMPLREALVHSRNLATINLVSELGVNTIRKRLAFLDVPHIPRDMSIALGNLGLSPMKMAQIFSVFANKGHMIEPKIVSKIISRDGAVLYAKRSKEIEGFTTPEQAYMMTDILQDVIKRGTGRNAKVDGIELAGKTGTTNKNVDAWFCGYSPTVEVVVWFGRDNNRPIGRSATGGAIAAPAFAYYYKHLLKLYPDTKRTFDIPQGVFRGDYEGKSELYTKISPLPEIKKKNEDPFMDDGFEVTQDDDTYILDNKYEDISPEEDMGMAETIDIDEDPNAEPEESDPLHPTRNTPIVPASKDSGTMF
ncbi:Multimodular transpeptidase-transglycosylase [hydrothermal vent metagenome]|uniref:peptidoglycan glycosyltransferase n=1 Tax=hydrothermal vent metagenome TaxID=652676 RepID=A0A1W1EDW2_9ZZZZ